MSIIAEIGVGYETPLTVLKLVDWHICKNSNAFKHLSLKGLILLKRISLKQYCHEEDIYSLLTVQS
jgi:hypothetical protein